MNRTILILPDQIARNNSALMEVLKPERDAPPARILMIEANDWLARGGLRKDELVFRLSAFRHFERELLRRKLTVDRIPVRDAGACSSMLDALQAHVSSFATDEFVVMEPTAVADATALRSLSCAAEIPVHFTPNTMFITASWTQRGNILELHRLYSALRTELDILMDEGKPTGGLWCLTGDRISAGEALSHPELLIFPPDDISTAVMQMVESVFPDSPGSTEGFSLPVTHAQANDLVDFFIQRGLLGAGCYESLAPLLGIGLLNPHHLVKKAETGFKTGKISLQASEGLIRAVLGEREILYIEDWKEHRPLADTRPE